MCWIERPLTRMILIAGLGFGCVSLAAQSVPSTINYQGRLTDNTPQQAPVSNYVPMRFALYDAASGGTLLWQEPAAPSAALILVSGGVFSVTLGGNGVPLPAATFAAGADRWLEITLNAGTANEESLAPRQKFSATGYAAHAEDAGNAASVGGIPGASVQQVLAVNTCPAGEFFTQIRANGTVQCAPDQGITAVNATQGISGSIAGGTLNLSTDVTVQRRNATPTCASGQYLQSIAANGAPTCAADAGATVPLSLSGNPAAPVIQGAHTGGYAGVRGDSGGGHGVQGFTTAPGAWIAGVYGSHSPTNNYGMLGESGNGVVGLAVTAGGAGVYGQGTGTGAMVGVKGYSNSSTGYGVYGFTAGAGEGVLGTATTGLGMHGTATTGTGVQGEAGAGNGIYGSSATGNGVRGETTGAGSTAVLGYSNSNTGVGVWGSTLGGGTGVTGSATSGIGLKGTSSTGIAVSGSSGGSGLAAPAVFGNSTATTGFTYGVYGEADSTTGRGVYGHATAASGSTNGVVGESDSPSGVGVRAIGAGGAAAALQIEGGGVRVSGAGIDTHTPAFQINGAAGNLCNTSTCVEIDNSLINGNPNAFLFITEYGTNNPNTYTGQFRVRYGTVNCTATRWQICAVSATDLSGAKFFVFAVTP